MTQNPIPLGPCTPWPNRAEASVRVFRKHIDQLVQDFKNDRGPFDPGDKVWYYAIDENKLKRGKFGRWHKAEAVRLKKSMAIIDLGL